MIDNLTNTEIDIQIAGTKIWDYFYDLALLNGLKNNEYRNNLRIQFGDAVVELVRAIKEDIKSNQ